MEIDPPKGPVKCCQWCEGRALFYSDCISLLYPWVLRNKPRFRQVSTSIPDTLNLAGASSTPHLKRAFTESEADGAMFKESDRKTTETFEAVHRV